MYFKNLLLETLFTMIPSSFLIDSFKRLRLEFFSPPFSLFGVYSYHKSNYFYQMEQVDVNKIVCKEIGPSMEARPENIFVIYE